MLVRSGIILVKYWLSVSDEEQERRFTRAHRQPGQALEAEPDGPRGARPVGRLRRGQGRDVRVHRHQARRRGTSSTPTTRRRRGSTSSATSWRSCRTTRCPTTAVKLPPRQQRAVHPAADRQPDLGAAALRRALTSSAAGRAAVRARVKSQSGRARARAGRGPCGRGRARSVWNSLRSKSAPWRALARRRAPRATPARRPCS